MLAKTTNQLMANRITLCWMISVSSVQTNWQSLLVCIFQEAFFVVRQWSIGFQNHQSLQQKHAFWHPGWPCISWLKKVKKSLKIIIENLTWERHRLHSNLSWFDLVLDGCQLQQLLAKACVLAKQPIVDSNIFSPNNCNLANLLTFLKFLRCWRLNP